MATYRILYWQEIPTQVSAEDEHDEVTLPLAGGVLERVDRLAVERGLQGSDDYLAQWQWRDGGHRDGSALDVASAVKAELEAEHGGPTP